MSSASTDIAVVPTIPLCRDPCRVELVDSMGDDARVLDAARVSFHKTTQLPLTEKDIKLIQYLAKHKHMSPFRHVQFTLRIRAPEFVARQAYKHVVGLQGTCESITKDHAWNEISGRYVVLEELYCPMILHTQHASAKQCSGDPLSDSSSVVLLEQGLTQSYQCYLTLLKNGVAKEEARMVLPMSFMTEWMWTASLEALVHFVKLREDPHSQYEIQLMAKQVHQILLDVCPIAAQALLSTA